MPFPPPVPSGTGSAATSGGLRSADGRPMDLVLLEESGRDLRAVLKPGSVVSGRVVERFENGSYLFTLRGRNLIAESSVPLLRDSVVRFAVVAAGEAISLRLVDGAARDRAETSDLAARLSALRLPVDGATRSALQAFEDAGAPLDRLRLDRAARALAAAPGPERPALAAAHAQLARAGLPVTPVTLRLAAQALRPGLPAPAASLAHSLAPVSAALAAPTAGAAGAAPAAGGAAAPPAAGSSAASSAPISTPTQPPAPVAGTASETAAQRGPLPTAAAPLADPSLARPTTTAPTSSPFPPPTTNLQLAIGAGTAFVDFAPDPGAGGTTAAARALDLAGIRPAAPGFEADRSPPGTHHRAAAAVDDAAEARSLVHHLAVLARTLEAVAPAQREAAEAVHQSIREGVAERFLPPTALDDYEVVLPLPLQQQGQPVPARVAVSRRHTAADGDASFVRIDLELVTLGPLSIRLSALERGPMAVVLLATGSAVAALEAEREDLASDLEAMGLEVAVRIDHLLAAETDRAR